MRRMQKRGISDIQMRLVLTFGSFDYQKGGCDLAFISDSMLRELRNAVDKLSDVGVVVSPGGGIVTVEHLTKKVRRTALSS
jgi:hypothetical protein